MPTLRSLVALAGTMACVSFAGELKPSDCNGPVNGGLVPGSTAVSFLGKITPERVETFLTQIDFAGINRLIVNSDGGDVASALRLGRWVRDHGLDVEVRGLCFSACANYVFPAGGRKVICPGSLVMWHGSMEQKDIRELQMKYESLLLKAVGDPSSLSDDDRKYLTEMRAAFNHARELRDVQARLFDEIQVDEYIMRLGQEPIAYGIDSWTATVQVMERFGISKVAAPEGYGTLGYLKKAGFPFLGANLLSFGLDADGRVSRLAE